MDASVDTGYANRASPARVYYVHRRGLMMQYLSKIFKSKRNKAFFFIDTSHDETKY